MRAFAIRSLLIGAILFSQPLFAAERNILDEEVKSVETLIGEVQRLQKGRKVQSASADSVIQSMQGYVRFLNERNSLFKCRSSSAVFAVYAENQETADRYLKEAEAVRVSYQQLFPRTFSPASPAQILIYPKREDYLKYERVPAEGHAISMRAITPDLVHRGNKYEFTWVTSSNQKQHRLATYKQDVPYIFAHEVSHIMTNELVNPGRLSIQDIRPSIFLNEGLAEYFAARLYPEELGNRLSALRQAYGIVPAAAPVAEAQAAVKDISPSQPPVKVPAIRIDDYLAAEKLPSTGKDISIFYSEATLFVDWLMNLPHGPELVSALLTNHSVQQFEAQMRQHQRQYGLSSTGWEPYLPYRSEKLLTISSPTTSSAPPSSPPVELKKN